MGLTYTEASLIPLGELRTLIAIEQIKHEGFRETKREDFFDLLKRT